LYHYIVVNDRIDRAVAAISSIIDAEGLKLSRSEASESLIRELEDGIQRAIDHYSARK
jgi:guanylate kinase